MTRPRRSGEDKVTEGATGDSTPRWSAKDAGGLRWWRRDCRRAAASVGVAKVNGSCAGRTGCMYYPCVLYSSTYLAVSKTDKCSRERILRWARHLRLSPIRPRSYGCPSARRQCLELSRHPGGCKQTVASLSECQLLPHARAPQRQWPSFFRPQ